jgi:hypothetical protein
MSREPYSGGQRGAYCTHCKQYVGPDWATHVASEEHQRAMKRLEEPEQHSLEGFYD